MYFDPLLDVLFKSLHFTAIALGELMIYLLPIVAVGVTCQLVSMRCTTSLRYRKVMAWVDAVEACTDIHRLAKMAATGASYMESARVPSTDYLMRCYVALQKCRDARDMIDGARNVELVRKKIAEEMLPSNKAEILLYAATDDPRLIDSFGKETFAKLFYGELDKALLRGRSGDLVELEGYHSLMTHKNLSVLDALEEYVRQEMQVLPGDWDDLLITLYDDPPVHMFDKYAWLSRQEVRRLAGQAVVQNDFMKAKVVLAYCLQDDPELDKDSKYREVIGDMLMAELICLVSEREVD
ncbi:MAG: hypothetical protein ABIP74_02800 [Candidatus Saccharimonas sp.]